MAHSPENGPTINITPERDAVIQAIIQANAYTAAVEAADPYKAWDRPALPFVDFQNHFSIVQPDIMRKSGGAIPWLQDEIGKGKPANILNAAGAPRMLADLHAEGVLTNGVALGLANKHLPIYDAMHIYPVNGDLLLEQPWMDLEEVKKRHGIDGFQLIYFFPQKGGRSEHMSPYPDISWEIYRRLYAQLAPGGILFAQVTEAIHENISWIRALETYMNQTVPNSMCWETVVPDTFSLTKSDKIPEIPRVTLLD